MEEKLRSIIGVLGRRTSEGELNWTRSEDDQEFVLVLNSGRISLSHGYDAMGEDDYLDLLVTNGEGTPVERVQGWRGEDYQILNWLWKRIDRKIRGVDETLTNILEEIAVDTNASDVNFEDSSES